MAVTVAESRKRGFASFLDDSMRFADGPHRLPSQQAKRGRSSPSAASIADLGVSLEFDPVDALQLIFPDADPQIQCPIVRSVQSPLDLRIAVARSTQPSPSYQCCALGGYVAWLRAAAVRRTD
ncbi:hypothetical protein GUJ93_ZPchr0012g21517 [Zizania palustris]|uniref:Uncharacterized protein n=1 Tax=Zizania palustris TaxID=103762 RepID=A0A8J6BZ56_ZIZPA|nr:hypothetical protein GUJ93_ZPchr0012g19223 [Zizania palustris]KAG8094949.1 hypothetical protein GUJ93_ZPchr0012g21517 [Zizania palustris]